MLLFVKGLTVILDAHSDTFSAGSVDSDAQGKIWGKGQPNLFFTFTHLRGHLNNTYYVYVAWNCRKRAFPEMPGTRVGKGKN